MEREVAGGDPALEHGQHRPPVRTRERAGLRDGGVVPLDCARERAQELGGHERHVRRQHDDDLGPASRSAAATPTMEARTSLPSSRISKGRSSPSAALPTTITSPNACGEHAVAALGERLALVARKRLRGAEARARAADEQGAGYARPVAYHARAVRLKGPSGASSRSR